MLPERNTSSSRIRKPEFQALCEYTSFFKAVEHLLCCHQGTFDKKQLSWSLQKHWRCLRMHEDASLDLCQRPRDQLPARSDGCWLRCPRPAGVGSGLPATNGRGRRAGSASWCQPISRRQNHLRFESGKGGLATREQGGCQSYYSLQLFRCLKLWIKTHP